MATERYCPDCDEETKQRLVAPADAPQGPKYQCLACPERREIEAMLSEKADESDQEVSNSA